jgi:hypothetical protein
MDQNERSGPAPGRRPASPARRVREGKQRLAARSDKKRMPRKMDIIAASRRRFEFT